MMIDFSFISLMTIVTAATALNVPRQTYCVNGLSYCGRNLVALGYKDRMIELMEANSEATDIEHMNDTLFNCNPTKDGSISFNSFCMFGCEVSGEGEDGFCAR
ncbi:hypothetical protein AC579_972 [Pseudocercospora musae]|uniref:Uncharacterized protein n=1 Tax=Pseudocercospora musae TaxID=113226 RepID=A0A139IU80_9PEZI|nr:hypothetical protein AC579_972 [Pseudocercospora musae]